VKYVCVQSIGGGAQWKGHDSIIDLVIISSEKRVKNLFEEWILSPQGDKP